MGIDAIVAKIVARVMPRLEQLERVVEKQQTLINNMFREGEVQSVDHPNGRVVAVAHGIETKPISRLEQAGDIVEWNPLSVGQRVIVVAPGGDLGKAFIIPGGFTDQVPQPDNRGAHKRTKIGNSLVTQSAAGLVIEVDGATFTFSAAGLSVEIGGTRFDFTAGGFAQGGGKQTHNEKNVGSDHVHGGITPGGADTLGPH